MKILKGDTVQVIAGKDKGKTGTVLEILRATDQVVVDGVHQVTRHQKNKRTRSQGQIITKSLPVHVSNVALVHKGKPVRIGYTVTTKDGKREKTRVARPSGEKI